LHHGQIEGCASERVRPRTRPLTQDESEAIADLEAEIERSTMNLNPIPTTRRCGPRATRPRRGSMHCEKRHQSWDKAEMAHAGAVVTIDRNGEPIITRGLIKRGDLKAIRKLRSVESDVIRPTQGDASSEPRADGERPTLPKSLVEGLTAARTRALRAELSAVRRSRLPQRCWRSSVAVRRAPTCRGSPLRSRPSGSMTTIASSRARTEASRLCGSGPRPPCRRARRQAA
jgi:hypothetical protein